MMVDLQDFLMQNSWVHSLGKFRFQNFLDHPQTKKDIDFLIRIRSMEKYDLFNEIRNYCVPDSIRKQNLEEAITCLGEQKVRELFQNIV